MLSRWRSGLRHTLGFRLALWYSAIFVGSSLALVVLTYWLLSASLRQYDREIIETTLVEYATAYRRGGVDALVGAVRADQAAAGYEPLFVRAVGPLGGIAFLSAPDAWRGLELTAPAAPPRGDSQSWSTVRDKAGRDLLEVASVRLSDGTVFQVGKSMARRTELLTRFRTILLLDFVSLGVIGLAAGAVFTSSALQPVRALIGSVREIMRTGRMRTRVPARDTGDALDELSLLFNAMLDRIEALIAGMRGALDNVAHDLRTPMMRLRGIAENALQSDHDPVALREALADCLEESDRLVAMLNTLMDISEAETGTMRLNLEPVDLGELVRTTVDLYEDLAESHGVQLRAADVATDVVALDRNRMRQVLANLVDNAIKYTPEGGSVEIDVHPREPWTIISVRDTGIGIPAEEQPRIWQRLYRGDKSRSERGLGLGLSLVKAIVEAHGGEVRVESTPGQGTLFELRVPRISRVPAVAADGQPQLSHPATPDLS